MIYLIGGWSGDRCYGKVGRVASSTDASAVMDRLRSLQTGCPLDLSVWLVMTGGPDDERGIHESLTSLRVRGEWFDFTGRDAVREVFEAYYALDGPYVPVVSDACNERLEPGSIVCEEHPDLAWPHGDCAGPGMLREDVTPPSSAAG